MTLHTETMWAIAHKHGLYYGSIWHTKDEATSEFGADSLSKNWEQCEEEGVRAVKVTITYEYPESLNSKERAE